MEARAVKPSIEEAPTVLGVRAPSGAAECPSCEAQPIGFTVGEDPAWCMWCEHWVKLPPTSEE